jgi:hypothetical protein
MDCFVASVFALRASADKPLLAMTKDLSRVLIERLAQRHVTLLLLAPVAAAGNRPVDHEIMTIDE